MADLDVSWNQYNTLIERLALSIHESGWQFNQIVCIARGGLRVGDVLSRIYEIPLAILSTHSYTAEGGTVRGELVIAEHMTMSSPGLGDRILLVDDMVDSGHTLEAVAKTLPLRFPHIREQRTAVRLVEGLLRLQAGFPRRIPSRQSVDPSALRGLRHAAARSAPGKARQAVRRALTSGNRTNLRHESDFRAIFRREYCLPNAPELRCAWSSHPDSSPKADGRGATAANGKSECDTEG